MHGAAEIAEHSVAGPDHGAIWFVVGRRGIGTGSHDGEVDPVVALVDQATTDVGRHLGLGASDQPDVAALQLRSNPIGRCAGRLQRCDLGVVLDRTHRSDDVVGPRDLRAVEMGQQVDQESGPHTVADGNGSGTTSEAGDQIDRIVGLVPGDEIEHVGTVDDPGCLEAGHHQGGVAIDGQHEHGEPFERHGLVAGEVRQFGTDREQGDLHVDGTHAVSDPFDAVEEHGAQARALSGPSHYPHAVMPALDAIRPTLQSMLDDALVTHRVPGAVIGVVRGDEEVIVAGGIANVSTGVEVTTDTLFQVGSIAKIYTASLVMQLVHAGVVELDEPVRGALQEFRVADDTATLTITPRHLLSHTSGIQGDHFLDCGRNPDALWRYVSTLEDVGQVHPPDDLFSYCNAGFGVLGRLIEEATGDHFTRALQRRLLRPLALHRTVSLAEQAIIHRVAAGHHHRGKDVGVNPWTLARFNVAIGGIIADAGDVLTFARLHLAGGKSADGKQVIPSRALAEMQEGQAEIPGTTEERGLGWAITKWDDTEVLGHDGDTVGQRAFLRVIPDADAAIVVLTNSPRGEHVADAAFSLVGTELLGLRPPSLPIPLAVDDRPDPSACSGIYERLHQRLAIAGGEDGTLRMTIIPDDLFSLAGMAERTLTLHPVDARRFVTTDPVTDRQSLVVMVEGDDDRPAYVHYGRRAHARIA